MSEEPELDIYAWTIKRAQLFKKNNKIMSSQKSKSQNYQIRIPAGPATMLNKFTYDRDKKVADFLIDIIFLFHGLLEKPEELEKIVGNIVYQKYFEER